MPDTIAALATPAGRSGIGVVRLSGPDALEIAGKMIGPSGENLSPRVAHLRELYIPSTSELLDRAIVTYFAAPHSYSGEDTVEISCHGAPVLLRQVMDICLSLGARMADAGEFTLRALSNGRIDLSQAEAVRDLIDAQTAAAARQAVRHLSGEMSAALQPLRDEILSVIVVLESALEFVEDDLPRTQTDAVASALTTVAEKARRLSDTFRSGHLIRDGLRVAIVGRPNVGKSSLFNALLGIERAIVTEVAGTTRDQLHERIAINGVPISLIDTAGLRETEDVVESLGVERSRAIMADADLVLVMLDASVQTSEDDRNILKSARDLEYIVALNKIDLVPSTDVDRLVAAEHSSLAYLRERITPVSAKTGEGLDDLRLAMLHPFAGRELTDGGFLITDARHHDLLLRTAEEIDGSIREIKAGRSEEIVLVGLHNSLRYLGEITGETTTEEMLTQIFATFCIGK